MKEISHSIPRGSDPLLYLIFKWGIYLLTVFLTLTSTSWFAGFFFLEINMFILIGLTLTFSTPPGVILKYFLFQSLNTFMLIITWFCANHFINWATLMFFFSFFMNKLGTPPFHLWLLSVIKFMDMKILSLLLVLQKFPFFSILFTIVTLPLPFFFFLLSSGLSLLGLISQNAFPYIFFFSSSLQAVFMVLSSFISKKIFLYLLTVYSVIIFFMIYFLLFYYPHFPNFSMLECTVVLFMLLGLPPSPVFFLKFFFICYFFSAEPSIINSTLALIFSVSVGLYFFWFINNLGALSWKLSHRPTVYFNVILLVVFLSTTMVFL